MKNINKVRWREKYKIINTSEFFFLDNNFSIIAMVTVKFYPHRSTKIQFYYSTKIKYEKYFYQNKEFFLILVKKIYIFHPLPT